ncbi:adenylate cyclase [Erythrobacter sp. NAP1]|uniref:winged helix-turn-helix domain-containing protein n=1 Tax=Erythrobacter sp. NAP1 TaxID=237727 RepID=UPI000068782E|nr:winged helix-turn-helix domain-containing protein [Erythrobacter sp. NAP1]EAQ28043.1 adenylate cyclase [Erythrobacter sp. NAP1]
MNDQIGSSDEALERQVGRVDLAHHGDFRLGSILVQPSLRRITGPDGERMLEPKVMQVLIALSSPVGTILSRDDLIDRCWDGRVVGDTSINRVISILRTGLREVAGDAAVVENVPKVGYRIVVREAPDDVLEKPAPDVIEQPTKPKVAATRRLQANRRATIIIAGALAVLALVGAAIWLKPFAGGPVGTVRMAMLPLEISEGVDPIYAAGLESELRAEFARVGAMEVTASESAKLLLGENLEPAEIGTKLGVQFVWSGRFEVEAERIVLDVNVVNSETGETVLSQSVNSATDSAQSLPFRTARAVATALDRPVRATATQETISASDFRLYLVATGLLKTRGQDQVGAAREILELVTARNGDFADGWGALAMAYFLQRPSDPSQIEGNLAKALETAEKAVAIEPNTIGALKVFGMSAKDAETALASLGRVVKLDPGDSEGWFWLGIVQRRFVLDGADPLTSARTMIEIDPLWPPSWNGSTLAAEFGDMQMAREMEQDILAASVTPSQRLLVEARLARLDGDLSEYLRLTRRAALTNTEAERMFSQNLLERAVRILLNLPPQEGLVMPIPGAPQMLMEQLYRENLLDRDVLAANGLTGASAWDDRNFIAVVLPLYLQYDRHDELLADYDARFASHANYILYTQQASEPERIVGDISPYLVMALRRAGRVAEAKRHLASLEEAVKTMRGVGRPWLDLVLFEIDVAALKNDNERAIELVRQLPDFGWPHAFARVNPTVINLLRGDPLYDEIRSLPEVRQVLQPIRSQLARERGEILALEL